MTRYALGLDYGTESARAILVELESGEEAAQAVRNYPDGVITDALPIPGGAKLDRDWALQNPADWSALLRDIVREVLTASGAKGDQVIGIGVDFTACTVVPTDGDGTPLCLMDRWRANPHAWAKLWKHHGADPEVREIMEVATARHEKFLPYYGGCMSSEWLLPKALQILREAPEVYAAAKYIVEGGDWLVWHLTGRLARNATAAGYKGTWVHELGYPGGEFLAAIDSGIVDLFDRRIAGPIVAPGDKVGELADGIAKELGLAPGIAVSAATIDAHAGVPGSGVVTPNIMTIIMGTSSCHLMLSEEPVLFEGFAGLVKDGIIRGYFGYESGQTAVGDIFGWFVDHCAPASLTAEADSRGVTCHEVLTERAEALRPGESGLLALDWWNGNRSILMDAQLSGLLVGATLDTRPHEVYRALIEATAFGTRRIVQSYDEAGVAVKEIVACGGLAERNPMLLQINADILNRPISIAASSQTVALGAAMFGALAAGAEGGGFDTIEEAAKRMVKPFRERYEPIRENARIYDELYAEYGRLHDIFGRTEKTMARLRQIAAAPR